MRPHTTARSWEGGGGNPPPPLGGGIATSPSMLLAVDCGHYYSTQQLSPALMGQKLQTAFRDPSGGVNLQVVFRDLSVHKQLFAPGTHWVLAMACTGIRKTLGVGQDFGAMHPTADLIAKNGQLQILVKFCGWNHAGVCLEFPCHQPHAHARFPKSQEMGRVGSSSPPSSPGEGRGGGELLPLLPCSWQLCVVSIIALNSCHLP